MSGEVFLMGNSSVTKVAGVIHVSYPANSTLVVKGTSSGKQFAKDTNTTSSAKAYIFLAPTGNASYTLTATNTAGKTVSKQVYVAKDQVQSVTLAYFSATIKVTYPAKSKCIIKNNSGTQVASDTNTGTAAKTWTATVDATGTYTVTATATGSSGKTKSTTVSITAEGQVEVVTLMFKLYLFTSGEGVVDDWTPLYGGYTNAAVTSKKMTLNGGENFYWSSTVAVTSNNAIDLSGYSKLVVDVQTNKAATDNVYAWVGVSATKFTRGSDSSTISISNSAAYTKISTTTRDEIEVDIANINTGYVFVASDGTNINTTVYNIWLE